MAKRDQLAPRRATALPGSMAALVPEFLDWSGAVGLSAATQEVRERYVLDFCAWCEERSLTRAKEVTRPVLMRYQRHLFHYRKGDGKPLSWSSQHGRLVALRAFFRWLIQESRLLYNPASELQLPRRPPRLPRAVLTQSEAEAVLREADPSTTRGLRDRAILETLYSTGIRRMELIGLGVFDIDPASGVLWVRKGKGGRERVVPIGERACRWIDRYLLESRPQLALAPNDATLFLADSGRAFHPQFLSRVVRGYVDQSGVGKPGSCHLFRHTMATLMLEGGADIRFIQVMLGHASISTTEIYTRVSIRKLKAVYEQTHPARMSRSASASLSDGQVEDVDELRDDLLSGLEVESAEEALDDVLEGDTTVQDRSP